MDVTHLQLRADKWMNEFEKYLIEKFPDSPEYFYEIKRGTIFSPRVDNPTILVGGFSPPEHKLEDRDYWQKLSDIFERYYSQHLPI